MIQRGNPLPSDVEQGTTPPDGRPLAARSARNAPTSRKMVPTADPLWKSFGNCSATAAAMLCVRSSSVRCAASGGGVRSPVRPDT